jgi:hypothetical protein
MSDESKSLAPVGPSAAAEARQHRSALTWVQDGDLRTLSSVEANSAWALSMFTGGGGQLLSGQYLLGAGLIGADLLLLYLWWPAYFVLGAVSSVFAFRSARAVNRYVAARDAHADKSGPTPSEYGLLAAMQSANPHALVDARAAVDAGWQGPGSASAGAPASPTAKVSIGGIDVDSLRERLVQLAALRSNGVIDDAEHRERRIDALSILKGLDRDEMDQVLFHLLPMINEGYLSNEDVELLKRMGGG